MNNSVKVIVLGYQSSEFVVMKLIPKAINTPKGGVIVITKTRTIEVLKNKEVISHIAKLISQLS